MRYSVFVCSFLFLMALFSSLGGRAQSIITDSLHLVIAKSSTSNGERIEAMAQLSKIIAAQNKLPEALKIAKEAQQLSHREKDGRYGALIQSTLSYLHVQQDSLKLAFQAIDSAEQYLSHTTDKIIQGRVLFRRGWLEHIVENTDKAYQNMLKALRLLNEDGTDLYKSNIYHYLAAIHAYWGNTDKQLHYTRLCHDVAHRSGNPDAIANANLSMGTSYLYRFRKDDSQQQLLDSAAYFYRSVLQLTDSLKSRITLPSTRGIAALNMANLYFEFYPASYQDSAQVYLNEALSIGKKINNVDIIANSYGILSEYSLKENDYIRAEALLQMALTEIINSPGGTLSKGRITNALARVAEKSGNTAKALEYYKQYMKYDKELFDKEKLSITQRLEIQYQSEKKELALTATKQEALFTKKLNRYYLITIIAGLIALFFLFRSYHFKLKSSQQKQLLLTGEKNKAELQTNLKIEETARLRAERELMQERLNQLEKKLLAGTLQVAEKNTLMKELKDKLSLLDREDPLYRQIDRLISKNHDVDKGYNNIRTELSEISPDFIANLQQKAENKLTRLDLKYCSYILMGLTNKEIAVKLNVDPKSIRMARYRIKQKLNLQKEENLDQFINELGA
ncbi:transcriptional regulator [Albibacterium indicum]|uniref:transcriptional regulator n=1 Tax=Albibacterium indicum TaxID=2292082 RepID=UPI000E534F06|nr:LuxR C-terminal-related transcriptional regulator [Pedobacter indicus]